MRIVLILTDIYPAGEQPIEGVTAEALWQSVRKHGQKDVAFIADRERICGASAGDSQAGGYRHYPWGRQRMAGRGGASEGASGQGLNRDTLFSSLQARLRGEVVRTSRWPAIPP